jgi:hypothetical protein
MLVLFVTRVVAVHHVCCSAVLLLLCATDETPFEDRYHVLHVHDVLQKTSRVTRPVANCRDDCY